MAKMQNHASVCVDMSQGQDQATSYTNTSSMGCSNSVMKIFRLGVVQYPVQDWQWTNPVSISNIPKSGPMVLATYSGHNGYALNE